MAVANRPPSLVAGWEGAWGLNVRKALVALRDEGPLTLQEVARVLRWSALHADLTSGHRLGPDHGAEMLAQAILEDAATVVVHTDDDRYSIPSDLTRFVSPFTGMSLALHTPEEQAAAKAKNDAERPVRNWSNSGVYARKWGGRLPRRTYTTDEIVAKAQEILALGWLSGDRIVKDQHGVTIDGYLRGDALAKLGIDPDTGFDPRSGEPYVERRAFNNDAARLLFALTANWSTLKAPTREAIAKQVLGRDKAADLTLEAVSGLIRPFAELMSAPTSTVPTVDESPAAAAVVVDLAPKSSVPKEWNDDALELLERVKQSGYHGTTSKELGPSEHGSVSAHLSRLADAGLIFMLAERRLNANVYVAPPWQQERRLGKRKRTGRVVLVTPPTPAPAPAEFSNAKVAAMPWRAAALNAEGKPYVWNDGKARLWIGALPSGDATVAECVDAIIADLNTKVPFLLPMICERLANR